MTFSNIKIQFQINAGPQINARVPGINAGGVYFKFDYFDPAFL